MSTSYGDMKILVVEDDIDLLSETVEFLRIKADHIHSAKDGLEALELIRSNLYDVVITDITMPRMDGLELLEYTKTTFPHIEVIIISAYDDFAKIKKALRLGVYNYLLKADPYMELIESLDAIYEKYLQRAQNQQAWAILSQYTQAIDQTVIVYKTDPDGFFEEINAHFSDIFGYRFDEIVHQSTKILSHPSTSKEVHSILWKTIQSKKIFSSLMKNRTKSGESVYLNVSIHPILDKYGQIIQYYVIAYDMTLLIRQKNIITRTKEHFKSTLDAIPNFVLLTNGVKVQEMNTNFLDFLGFDSLESFLQEHECVCEYFVKSTGYLSQLQWHAMLSSPKKYGGSSYRVKMYDKNHELRIFLVDIVHQEEHRRILAVFTDITSEIRLEEHKAVQNQRLASMGEMIGNIAHQWRQPLSTISATVTNIQMGFDFDDMEKEEVLEEFKTINHSVQFLSNTIDDFRNFLKEDKQKVLIHPKEIIHEALKFVHFALKNHSIEVLVQEKLDPKCMIFGVKNEIIQVLLNILHNAQDALSTQKKSQKKIEILVDSFKTRIKIRIKDNAGGIPPEIIGKIFDPYFTTKHQSQGTGIGLYMSKSIINSLEGTLEAYNENDGAVFEIVLACSSSV